MKDIRQTRQFINGIKKISLGDKLVFCDIDGTIYRNALFLDIVELLIADGYMKNKTILRNYHKYKKARKNREITYDEFLMYAVISVFENILNNKTLHSSILEEYAKYILKNNGKHILIYTLRKLKELQSNGYKIIFISGSPNEIVHKFVKSYNFDLGFGTLLERDSNGFYTGNRQVLAGSAAKLKLMNDIINICQPSYVISFGDTNGDFDMLTNSNLGIAINPSSELYNKIKNYDSILAIIERKDLIVELDYNARQSITVL